MMAIESEVYGRSVEGIRVVIEQRILRAGFADG